MRIARYASIKIVKLERRDCLPKAGPRRFLPSPPDLWLRGVEGQVLSFLFFFSLFQKRIGADIEKRRNSCGTCGVARKIRRRRTLSSSTLNAVLLESFDVLLSHQPS